jgi:hypothetical protein
VPLSALAAAAVLSVSIHSSARVPVTCYGTCTYTIELTVVEQLRDGRVAAISATVPHHAHGAKLRTVVVATAKGTTTGSSSPQVRLNPAGRRLAARFGRLRAGVSTQIPQCEPGPQPLVSPPPGGPGPTGIEGGIYLVGGPAPSCSAPPVPRPPVEGTVAVFDASGAFVTSEAVNGLFSLSLPAGTYTVRAQLPQDPVDTSGPDKNFCRAPAPVTVADGNQTAVEIYCDVP